MEAIKLNIPKAVVKKELLKNELKIILEVIKNLLHKVSKIQDAIYYIMVNKIEGKIKRKGEKLPCKTLTIEGIPKEHKPLGMVYLEKCFCKIITL